MRVRAGLGGLALAFTPGFNVANVGAVADQAAHDYGVGLAVIGLYTTALFVSHAVMQVPVGRLCDRFGARAVGAAGLAVVACSSVAALGLREAWFAIAMRFVAGFGTAASFVGGSDYVRATIGTPFAQGMYGAMSMAAGGLAVGLLPIWGTWQAPFATAALVAAAGLVVIAFAPREAARPPAGRELPTVLDRRLIPLAVMHAASFGLSVIVGNWVVTLLHRAGGVSDHLAGLAGGLVLFLGIVSRPLGGRLVGHTTALRASFLAAGLGIAALAVAHPLPLAFAAAALVGLAVGVPFAPAFSGAAHLRPDAPGAAVGLVNMVAAVAILAGTPLVGLTFSLPGNGRIGFAVMAALCAAAALAVRRRSAAEQ